MELRANAAVERAVTFKRELLAGVSAFSLDERRFSTPGLLQPAFVAITHAYTFDRGYSTNSRRPALRPKRVDGSRKDGVFEGAALMTRLSFRAIVPAARVLQHVTSQARQR